MDQSTKTDKRTQRSRATVLAETYRQLSKAGLASVSVDEIARASGVSKTTIYRHWPSRSALLIDACSKLGGMIEAPDTGSLRDDIHALLSGLAEHLRTASWSSVVPSIVDAAERDGDVLSMQTAWHASLMAPYSVVVERAKARGEVPADARAHDIIAMTVGALFYRRWFSREAIDAGFVDAIVSGALAAVAR